MATSLWSLLKEYKVVIPIIQRDYAQGRKTNKIPLIRERFLNALRLTVKSSDAPLELDFIYGYINTIQNESSEITKYFVPLDGQQRLTTLFLLHWYIAAKENKLDLAESILARFSYQTRHSSRVFCEQIVKFVPNDFVKPISETIINEPWFFTNWKSDPTINSMLTMLDSIQEKFQPLNDVWPKLTSETPKIIFHLLPMEKLGLPDDLYIKMNSRGKELTDFEYFKSRFSEILNTHDAEIFNNNIDQEWSDLFWGIYKNNEAVDIAKSVDNAFLRFFKFITDILISKHNIEFHKHNDNYSLHEEVYKNQSENIDFLFSSLNLFSEIQVSNSNFFDSNFYVNLEDANENNTRLFFLNATTDLFRKCADKYDASLRLNPFSFGEQLMLYACIIHLKHKTTYFPDRIRKVRNLITNSNDEVRRENINSLILSVSEIILKGTISEDSKFNSNQIRDEETKSNFIEKDFSLKKVINKLEDHDLLQGCLRLFSLEDNLAESANVFNSLFTPKCNYEDISRALFTFGDYTQDFGRSYTQMGNSKNYTWRELFTPSNYKAGFDKTREILYKLLNHLIKKPQSNIQEIITEYLSSFDSELKKPKDWKYYFIKHIEFRKNEDGFYYWDNDNNPYECIMMRRTKLNGKHWSPFLYTIKERSNITLNLEEYGDPLVLTKGSISIKILNYNNGYKLYSSDEDGSKFLEKISETAKLNSDGTLEIKQNIEGIDLEDRIEKGVEMIKLIADALDS
jgi:hypothetical protein